MREKAVCGELGSVLTSEPLANATDCANMLQEKGTGCDTDEGCKFWAFALGSESSGNPGECREVRMDLATARHNYRIWNDDGVERCFEAGGEKEIPWELHEGAYDFYILVEVSS